MIYGDLTDVDTAHLRGIWSRLATNPVDGRHGPTATLVLRLLDEIDNLRAAQRDGQEVGDE